MHSSSENLLKYFEYDPLPAWLTDVGRSFYDIAHRVASDLDGPEATACLRKLLEARDCALRAAS